MANDDSNKLLPGDNPRETLEGHRERGPKRYSYTASDLAEASKYSPLSTFPNLDKSDLTSVAVHVVRGVQRKIQPREPTDEELDTWVLCTREQWDARYPKFYMYECAMCDGILTYAGLCSAHGGPKAPPTSLIKGYYNIRLGNRNVPIHRIIAGAPTGMSTHHKDRNKLNNRAENLEVLTKEVHYFIHTGRGAAPTAPEECELPPEGWECSREKGHDGPCAASMCDLCYKPNVACPRHQTKYTPKCLCGHAEWCSVCTSY